MVECRSVTGELLRLTRAGIGCHIGNYYVGTLAYADDVVLIAPTASATVSYTHLTLPTIYSV